MGRSAAEDDVRLNEVLENIGHRKQKERAEGVKQLRAFFDRSQGASNVGILTDKAYHKLLEAIFKATLLEKQSYLSAVKTTKASALNRLVACADATRAVVRAGATKLKAKTIEATVEHIIQTLPIADGSFLEPIAQHYLKILSTIFEHKANVEYLKVHIWLDLIDFCLLGINRYLDEHEGEPAGLSRSFSGLGSGSLGSNGQGSGGTGSITKQNVEDLFQIAFFLVSTSISPLATRYELITDSTIRFLQFPNSSVSQVHQLAFSILNAVLLFARADYTSFSLSLSQNAIPAIARFWQGRSLAKDEMLNSVRDEMLILLIHTHPHLEKCVRENGNAGFLETLESLADVLRVDYAKRSSRDQLHLDDLEMIDIGVGASNSHPFGLPNLQLRPNNTRGERNWGQLQVIGILERLLRIGSQLEASNEMLKSKEDETEHPRKRQKRVQSVDRILHPLVHGDAHTKLACLHVLPFILHNHDFELEELAVLLQQLHQFAHDKRGTLASWALLASSSCTYQRNAPNLSPGDWLQFWQTACRALTSNTTCRTASMQIHCLLAHKLVLLHDVGEDVNAIVTSTDTHGPVILSESSMHLMTHLLHARVTEVPGASLEASRHVVRWLFRIWTPDDKFFATHQSLHVTPLAFTTLLRICLGLQRKNPRATTLSCGTVAQAWRNHLDTLEMMRYLLLLEDADVKANLPSCFSCPVSPSTASSPNFARSSHFRLILKLVGELLPAKFQSLATNWKNYTTDRSTPMTLDFFSCGVRSCLTALLSLGFFAEPMSQPIQELGTYVEGFGKDILSYASDFESRGQKEARALFENLLQEVQPFVPACTIDSIIEPVPDEGPLLSFLALISDECTRRMTALTSLPLEDVDDLMDTDDEHSTEQSQHMVEGPKNVFPRQELALSMDTSTFYSGISGRLVLFSERRSNQVDPGLIPSSFVDYLVSLADEDFISSRSVVLEVLNSDLMMEDADAARLVTQLAVLLSASLFNRCEVVMVFCLDVLLSLGPRWSSEGDVDEGSMKEVASQLYEYFIGTALENDITTNEVQKRIASLLLFLMQSEPEYGARALPSPKASLFNILKNSSISIRFFLANRLPDIFGYFLLESHDQLFLDILEILPSQSTWLEGMSFRMYALARLASKWSNLLRRCIYHIFEIPGKLAGAVEHATRCLRDVAHALNLEGAHDILDLFAPQLLFTWIENEQISNLPYKVFGFLSLKDFILEVRDELTGLVSMRGEEERLEEIATILDTSHSKLIQSSFTKVMAYSISQDAKASKISGVRSTVHESRIRARLGQDVFFQLLNENFVEIVALIFSIMDQESGIEKNFKKSKDLAYAGETLTKIKALGSSVTTLPPNQQPMFSSKTFPIQIQFLCSRTEYVQSTLYTPALVTYMCRRLINTVHPALGSLHACSVLRKLRVLVCLAGETVLKGYPLEMLLQVLCHFLADVECADDAIGLAKYLLEHGTDHLSKNPSFVAGIGLSYFATLRAFLQSDQSSTTQESQFKNTMSTAQTFRDWFKKYLMGYETSELRGQSKNNFEKLLRAAYDVESFGNADAGSSESRLLFQLLQDERGKRPLLHPASRKAALGMLCLDFSQPSSFRKDLFGKDEAAMANAAFVWKSCFGRTVSNQYLSWAARSLGRAFAASGHIHNELVRESGLKQFDELSEDSAVKSRSRASILKILEELTLEGDNRIAGLSESALRFILSSSDDPSSSGLHKSFSSHLYLASLWSPYEIPGSDRHKKVLDESTKSDLLCADAVLRKDWLQHLCIGIAQSVPNDCLLLALIPILKAVSEFAERVFPFVLHLVLTAPAGNHQISKQMLSKAFVEWLSAGQIVDRQHLRILINAILYLRTQAVPDERSSAERSRWLDIDYSKAARAATLCGMHKTALMFVEEFVSTPSKSSRRPSLAAEFPKVPNDILLTIFESIDDPDMYYGVEQPATLDSILARFEYEKDGPKSLAFRGAQYDSHVRRENGGSTQDLFSLVKSLDVLNQSGLSHALLQGQQTTGMTSESLDSMFQTARKLEQWDLPVPPNHNSNAATIYKAFQMVHIASDRSKITVALNEGLEKVMRNLVEGRLSANSLRESLQTLASLTEMDEIMSSRGSDEFEDLLGRFQLRSEWMKTGRFDDVATILSTRGTVLSTLSKGTKLQEIMNVPLLDTRVVEVRAALLSSRLHRAHNALQESLSLATSLIDLVKPCSDLGIQAAISVHMEAANTLWDQGEMASSIRMLQALDEEKTFKEQTIVVGRSNLLSQIGYQVSVARLERADRIVDKYLRPALKELNGKTSGSEAGQVFHQFAVFCDQQLQDPDSLEDLERLRKLKSDKGAEVKELEKLVRTASSPSEKTRYRSYHKKAITWLKIDADEYQRQSESQDAFLRQCLENYLLALSASDDHNTNALRFTALWLEHSEDQPSNEAVARHLSNVPSRKFATLMNQLTSRLQENQSPFQKLLYHLVKHICQEHPYHGVYQIYASTKSKPEDKDDAAISRQKTAEKLSHEMKSTSVGSLWQSIYESNDKYCSLAAEKDDSYRAGRKYQLTQSKRAVSLSNLLLRHKIPPPTVNIPLASNLDYSGVPKMQKFDPLFSIASGVSAPKILTVLADNGRRYRQLVKGGNDDLRQDAIMEQVFEQVSELLKTNRSTRQRNLSIRTYKVLPLSSSAGVIEFVPDTIPLHDFLMPAHEKYFPKDLKPSQCRKEIADAQPKSIDLRVAKFRAIAERFHPVMRYFFTENFPDPDQWYASRLAYTQSTAAISILGHVLGLGDRHGHNILLDNKSGEVVHIDLGVAFEMGRVLPVPELVPFRLTRDIIDGMGITKTEGVFRRCCEFTLEALRKEVYSIMTILDVLRYDPLYSWSMSPVRLEKLQKEQSAVPQVDLGKPTERIASVNEPGEADRALTVVNKKLSKTLSVTATVNDLINQARDEKNLAVLYCGWAAYA